MRLILSGFTRRVRAGALCCARRGLLRQRRRDVSCCLPLLYFTCQLRLAICLLRDYADGAIIR